MNTKDIEIIKAKIEKSKIIIGKERDKLREVYAELESLLDPIEEADGEFTAALRYLDSGLDSISTQF